MSLSTADRPTEAQQAPVAAETRAARATLEVVVGIHRGVKVALDGGDFRIGSAPDADIILRDPGIAAEHAILRVGRHSIHIYAAGGDVGIGEAVLADGHGCGLRPPVDVVIGEARLRIDITHFGGLWRQGATAAVLVAGAILFALPPLWVVAPRLGVPAALPALGNWGRAWADAISGAKSATPPVTEAPPVPGLSAARVATTALVIATAGALPDAGVSAATAEAAALVMASAETPPSIGLPAAEVEAAAQRLTAHLDTAGLRGLSASAAGQSVVVAGSIGKAQADAWTEAQQWFDKTYGGRLIIAAKVAFDDVRPGPAMNVQAVWLGQYPYVISAEGTRYYKGAFLDNGWIIKDIGNDRIILAKANETLALVYR